jgi:2-dehydro-3-deoxygluconokinase
MPPHTIACFGEVLIRIASPGQSPIFASEGLAWNIAGAEANVAVALSHLGHRARMITALPESALGQAAIEQLQRHGVDLKHAISSADGRMGLYFLSKGAGPRPSVITYDRVGSVFAETDPEAFDFPAALNGADWLHVSGVTPAIGPNSAEAACRAAECATEMGIPVSFDFNHRSKMWARWNGDPAPYLRRIVGAATLVFANDHDLAHVLDIKQEERGRSLKQAERAFAAFPRLAWLASAYRNVHSGERQSLTAELVTRTGRAMAGPADMEMIVDRIGGGDAFAGGLISAILQEKPLQRSIEEALAASVLKHYLPGDFLLAGQGDIDAFIDGAPSDVQR